MKKFCKNVAFFILPVVILAYPLDLFVSYHVKNTRLNKTGEYQVWNDVYSGKLNTDIAIYGSSRAFLHFNSQLLEDSLRLKAYNFGMDGSNFWLQYLRHTEYLANNAQPKIILLSVDLFTLSKRKDLYGKNQFLPYMLWNNEIKYFTSSFEGFTSYDYLIPLIRYSGNRDAIKLAIYNSIYGGSASYRHKGFKGSSEKWNDDFKNAKAKIHGYDVKFDQETIHLLERFLIECKEKGIRVIFVYAPEYVEGQKFVNNRNELMAFYHMTADKFDIKFLDYSNDILCYQKENFYNANHLNKTGADRFTSILSEDLKPLMPLKHRL